MDDVCIVYNEDSVAWPSFIEEIFDDPKFSMKKELDVSIAKMRNPKPMSKFTIFIASPGHLDYLRNNINLNYRDLVPDATTGILFICGVEMDEFSQRGKDGKPLSERFQNFKGLRSFDHDHTKEMAEHVKKEILRNKSYAAVGVTSRAADQSKSKAFRILPDTARSEDSTLITIAFEEQVAKTPSEAKVEVLLSDEISDDLTLAMPAEWINPYTYSFLAPEHREGNVNARILMNGKLVGSKTLTYVSSVSKFSSLSQLYIHQMTSLCTLLKKRGAPVEDIDACLSSLFDVDSTTELPAEAFELLFGIYRHGGSNEATDSELPTLLHFAAKHGFRELASKLTDLPDAQLANTIINCNRKMPEELARANKHSSLTTFLENFREINDGIEDLYVQCWGYVNVGGPANQNTDLSGYLKAKNRHLGIKGNSDYVVLYNSTPSDENQEDDLYIYTPVSALKANEERQTGVTAGKPPATGASATTKAPSTGARPPAPAPGRGVSMPSHQKQLVDIMETYKSGGLTMKEVEKEFGQWQQKFQAGTTPKSFKEKQEKLKKMKEDMETARGKGGAGGSNPQSRRTQNDPHSSSAPPPHLPPKRK